MLRERLLVYPDSLTVLELICHGHLLLCFQNILYDFVLNSCLHFCFTIESFPPAAASIKRE